MENLTAEKIAKMIDHSLLQPQMTRAEIDEGCELAKKYNTASVCVRGYDVAYCKEKLKGTDVMICAVTGFPHGNSTIESKVFESRDAIAKGADEVDVVIAIGLARSGEWDYIRREIKEVLDVCNEHKVTLKVIFENAYLTKEEIVKCCQICDELQVGFVKTSTGYAPTGATLEDLRLMRDNVRTTIDIKSAGGVRDLDQFIAYYNIGVLRQGTRSTAEIVEEAKRRGM